MDKTDKILKTLQPKFQEVTPIATEIIIPNHSGITGSQQAKNQLDTRYSTITHTHAVTSLTAGNHKMFYSNGSGAIIELSHGSASQVLTSNGTTSAPSWEEIPVPASVLFSQTQPARALNTTYQNTSGRNMFVSGSIRCLWSDDHVTTPDIAWFACKTDSSSPPTTVMHEGGTKQGAYVVTANTIADQAFYFGFFVKVNHYYRIDSTVSNSGTATLNYWNETINFEEGV